MKLALVLSGGSWRGAAHIGVLKVLHDNHIILDLLVGTSAGALVSGLYASGFLPGQISQLLKEELPHWWKKGEASSLFSLETKLKLPKLPLGIVQGNIIEKIIKKAVGNKKITDVQKGLAVTTTDLYTGDCVVYTNLYPLIKIGPNFVFSQNARLYEAIRASISIPGIFAPKKIGSRTLVDGGVVDNVPADVARSLGADRVIAVDLGFAVKQKEPFNNLIEILFQAHDIMGQRISDTVTSSYADITLRPKVGGASLWNLTKLSSFIEAGKREAENRIEEIKAILRPY